MATKRSTYVEPSDYFSPAMKKAAAEWDKKHETKKNAQTKKSSTGKKK